MNELPDKPSELIRLALGDLEKIEKDERYEVDMGVWHRHENDLDKCAVCLAGAVMAMHLDALVGQLLFPESFGPKTMHKLLALDYFRKGQIRNGLNQIGADSGSVPDYIKDGYLDICSYHIAPAEWKETMLKMAGDFEKLGL